MRLVDWWRLRSYFDRQFYLQRYPDVREAGINPLRHYMRHGRAEGRKPHRLFEPAYYVACCPEARNAETPLLHFIDTGGRLGNPHPLFDCAAYLAANPDAAGPGMNPLLHYIQRRKPPSTALEARGRAFARLEILDVHVELAFWQDPEGVLGFIAEPQQRPFFRAMRYDQLAAQLKP